MWRLATLFIYRLGTISAFEAYRANNMEQIIDWPVSWLSSKFISLLENSG